MGPAPVISTSSPIRSKLSAVWTALPNGSKKAEISSGISFGHPEGVERRQHQVLGEAAVAVHADADGVAAQVALAGAAVAAVAAGDVPFAADPLALREARDLGARPRRPRR